jgi:hypothetical protein
VRNSVQFFLTAWISRGKILMAIKTINSKAMFSPST